MASKTKTENFYDLIRPLFLVPFYGFNFQEGKFLQFDKVFVPTASFIAIKFHNRALITKTALTELLEIP